MSSETWLAMSAPLLPDGGMDLIAPPEARTRGARMVLLPIAVQATTPWPAMVPWMGEVLTSALALTPVRGDNHGGFSGYWTLTHRVTGHALMPFGVDTFGLDALRRLARWLDTQWPQLASLTADDAFNPPHAVCDQLCVFRADVSAWQPPADGRGRS